MHEGAHAPVRLLHTTQRLGRSSAFERAALCCPQAGQTGVPRASKWQFVFGGRERDGMDHTPLVWEAMPSATMTSAIPMPWPGQGARPR